MIKRDVLAALESINDAIFQRLCDDLLEYYNPNYKHLVEKGIHKFEDKTVKGTPDSYTRTNDGKIIAVQYTVSKPRIEDKIQEDIEKVARWGLKDDVIHVVSVCNSKITETIELAAKQKCDEYGWTNEVIELIEILDIIEKNFGARVRAQQYISCPVGEINTEEDFEQYVTLEYRKAAEKEIRDHYSQKLLSFDLDALDIHVQSKLGESASFEQVFSEKNVVLLGMAGAGKSTFLKRMFIAGLFWEGVCPVYCEFKEYADEDLIHWVKRNIEKQGRQISEQLIQHLLSKGKFALFLDGLDEVNRASRDIFIRKCLKDKRFANNVVIISSRDGELDLEGVFSKYAVFRVQPLDVRAIERFLHEQLGEESVPLWQHIYASTELQRFLSSPFHLAVLVAILQNKRTDEMQDFFQHLPNNRVFYSELFTSMLEWNRDWILESGVDHAFLKYVVCHIAYCMTQTLVFQLDAKLLNQYIVGALAEFGVSGEYTTQQITRLLISCKFLLMHKNRFSFEHKNLQDYFCSQSILSFYELDKKDERVRTAISDPAFLYALLFVIEEDIRFLENCLPDIQVEIFSRLVKENHEIPLTNRMIDYFTIELHKDVLTGNSNAGVLLQRWHNDPRIVQVVFEYLDEYYGKNGKVAFDPLLRSPSITHLFNIYSNIYFTTESRQTLTDFSIAAWERSFDHGRLAICLTLDVLRALGYRVEGLAGFIRSYYLRCLELKDKTIAKYLVSNATNYIIATEDRELYEKIGAFELNDIFLNGELLRMDEAFGEADFDNSYEVGQLVQRVLSATENFDVAIGQELARKVFEEVSYWSEQPEKVREIVGEESYRDALLLSLQDPAIDDWDLDSVLISLWDFREDHKTIEAVWRHCYLERDRMFTLEVPNSGIVYASHLRNTLLKMLWPTINAERAKQIISRLESAKSLERKLFILMHIWAITRCFGNRLQDGVSDIFEEVLQRLLHEYTLRMPELIDGAVFQSIEAKRCYERGVVDLGECQFSFEKFIDQVLNAFDQSALLEYCFDKLEQTGILEEAGVTLLLSIINSRGNRKYLHRLKRISERYPQNQLVKEIIFDWVRGEA